MFTLMKERRIFDQSNGFVQQFNETHVAEGWYGGMRSLDGRLHRRKEQ